MRYAVLVAGRERGVRLAAAEAWPGGTVDIDACRAAVAAAHGPAVAATCTCCRWPGSRTTEQGKPDRAAIGAAASAPQQPA